MKFLSNSRASLQKVGIEGTLIVLSTLPFIFSAKSEANSMLESWQIFSAIFSSGFFLLSAYYILRNTLRGKLMAGFAMTASLVAISPHLLTSPQSFLLAAVVFIFSLHKLSEFQVIRSFLKPTDSAERSLQRARWASITTIFLALTAFMFSAKTSLASEAGIFAAALLSQLLSIFWAMRQKSVFFKILSIVINSVMFYFAMMVFSLGNSWICALAIGLSAFVVLPQNTSAFDNKGNWWEPLLTNPARVSLSTFFLLCLLGTMLLTLPITSISENISLVDAAFTSVSAVCVTGLIVLDTPKDFTLMGQFFILLLIQFGGLGIMTITTVVLHAMGRRLSMQHEKIMNSPSDVEQLSLVDSLVKIIKFTFVMELFGAIILTALFKQTGLNAYDSIWKGIFTSISAFCNAGFALQSDSLISFQTNPLILHTIALLIIFGGIAPAVNLILPKWLAGKTIPIAPRIALVTTSVLLIGGTLFFLAFEWNGILSNLSVLDKFHNAWFQSVTLRTAGFNSVALENVMGSTFLIMLCMMFIGGSPGGTAGGVKTTTIGILAATFWSCATGSNEITIQNRRILPETVFKAVTIVVSGGFILLAVTLMLEVTQYVEARNLIFEATSALGTVGLSLGATSKLDSIGKIVIMFAMFAGRVGPITLFTVLSKERSPISSKHLDAKINLT